VKVLLARPQVATRPIVRFPLGLGYIAAALHNVGHKIDIFDQDALRWPNDKVESFIEQKQYDIFALSGMSGQYRDMKWMISLSKRYHPEAKVIVGGVGFSSMPQLIMDKTECDVGVIREGEHTIIDLLDAISVGRSLSEVKSIWYRDTGMVTANPHRERIRDLDTIPFPKWDLFDMEKYINQEYTASRWKMRGMCMVTSRGCPYQCTFCFRDFGRETFRRSTDNIIAEIKELIRRYDVNYISFLDELFNSTDKHVSDFCDRLLDERIKIKWDCRGRANLADKTLLNKMKMAGCEYMGFGVESANEDMLRNMRKKITIQEMRVAIDHAKQFHIRVGCSFIMGIVGETRKTISESVNFIKDNNLHKSYGFFYATPFPGTALYNTAREKGLIVDEEKYVENLGETYIKPYVNLTEMSDGELLSLKEETDNEIRADFKRKHPLWLAEEVFTYYKVNGLVRTLRRIAQKVIPKR